jgi:two-component sensor histidine kinase
MTARSAKSPKEMAEALRGRLSALSRAHELVRPAAGPGGQGGKPIELGELVAAILEPYTHGVQEVRVDLNGAALPVGANTTTSLALVLHELATNAAKYGCLSRGGGCLRVEWTQDASAVALTWTEQGGPPVAEAPKLEGFGSLLARKSITGQLGGDLAYEWRPEGLCVRMALPLDRLAY